MDEIAVRAFNWVGVSPDTELGLVLVITVRTDALFSIGETFLRILLVLLNFV